MKRCNQKKFFKHYINGTKGVISLFLAILMVPFVSIAGALINAGRINSAVAIFDEALCNASNSTLGTYDEFLRSRFALMALAQDTSSGGTKYHAVKADYSADDLVSDIFTYYMEKNVECLGNTYKTTNLNAAGLYPLSDPSVLYSSILQSGKITVPARLAMDWSSLEDIISHFTESLNVISKIEGLFSSGAKFASDITELSSKQDALEEAINNCNAARTEYTDAYNAFNGAAGQFNTLIANIESTERSVATYQRQVDQLSAEAQSLNQRITDMQAKIKEYQEDEEADHSEEIERLKEEIEKLEKELDEQSPEAKEASRNLQNAKEDLEDYKNDFSSKRSNAETKKSEYYTKIVAMRDAVSATSNAATAFQNAAKSIVNDGEAVITSTISTTYAMKSQANAKQQEELKKDINKLSEEEKRKREQAINKLQDDAVDQKNEGKVIESAIDTLKTNTNELTAFTNRDLTSEYRTIYDELHKRCVAVDGIVIPEEYSRIQYGDIYYSVTNPIEIADIKGLIEAIEQSIINNSAWAALKALVGFVDALFTISTRNDPNLVNVVNLDNYSCNGGLPSTIVRSEHPIASAYEKEDSKQSEYYKSLVNAYSASGSDSADCGDMGSVFSEMMSCITDLAGYISDFHLRNIPDIWNSATKLIKIILHNQLSEVFSRMSNIGEKMLLVGYVSYNTANRTTYTGSALTGASFSLPSTGLGSGYCFSGAETEYIFEGSMNEKDNQSSVFTALWIERLILNVFPILFDKTIMQLVADLLPTIIGSILVFLIALALESYVDAILLANGSTIPMIKTAVYITPEGIGDLLSKLTSLSLNEAEKRSLFDGASNTTAKLDNKYVPKSYDSFKSGQEERGDKVYDLFSWNYTKSVQVLLLVCRSKDTIVERLADIIQMEGSYKSHSGAATYDFNLDKSYTYIRASGSFSSDVFIKVSDSSSLTSKTRVIYNGY